MVLKTLRRLPANIYLFRVNNSNTRKPALQIRVG